MDVETALVCKIISTGQLEDAITRGVRPDLFADDDVREVYEYLLVHTRQYKSPPSITAVQSHIAESRISFEFQVPQDPLDFLIDRFVVLCKRRLAQEMVVELAAMTEDPKHGDEIDLRFMEVSRKLATLVPSTKVERFSEMDKRISKYEQNVREGHKPGIPFGFKTLDAWTGGIQAHEFVTVAGFSGLGKSTFLMAAAFNMWANGKTPLYISLEMEASAILRKFDAMAASLDYKKLKSLGLDEDQLVNWKKKAQEIRSHVSDIPVIDSIRNCSPDHIFAETIRYKPDIVIVDYLSLMRSGRPSRNMSLWQSLTEITQDLKQNCRTLKVPIMAAAQTNRAGGKDGADLDNIGYSLSIVQDSDIMVGLHADDDMKQAKLMQLRLKKNRDGRLGEFNAVWDHENMVFRDQDPRDLFNRPGPKE